MQHPSAKAVQSRLLRRPSGDKYTRGIFALPNSFSKCKQFIQSLSVIFSCISLSCPPEFLSEPPQSSGEQDFSFKLCDKALNCFFPRRLRQWAQ